MPQAAPQSNSTSSLPPGYTLDSDNGLPPGYTLDESKTPDAPKPPSLYQRLTQPDQTTANPVARFFSNVGGAVIGAPGAAASAIAHPIDTLKGMGNSVNQAIDAYANPATRPTFKGAMSVLPEALGMATGNVAAGEAGGAVLGKAGDAVGGVRSAARDASFKEYPTNGPQLNKGAARLGRAGGAVAGGGIGAALPIPGAGTAGGFAGFELGPSMMEKVLGTPELGTTRNPGPFSKIPARVPAAMRSDPFSPTEIAAPKNPSGVSLYPEPREPLPGDKPGAMWSVGREKNLPQAAQRGAPGAADVMRNTGKPIIFSPKEGVGYPGPRPNVAPEADDPAQAPDANQGPIASLLDYDPVQARQAFQNPIVQHALNTLNPGAANSVIRKYGVADTRKYFSNRGRNG